MGGLNRLRDGFRSLFSLTLELDCGEACLGLR